MPKCIRCGADTALGGLCEIHARAIAACNDVTAEQPNAYRMGVIASELAWDAVLSCFDA